MREGHLARSARSFFAGRTASRRSKSQETVGQPAVFFYFALAFARKILRMFDRCVGNWEYNKEKMKARVSATVRRLEA